jgi:hypothetical protein
VATRASCKKRVAGSLPFVRDSFLGIGREALATTVRLFDERGEIVDRKEQPVGTKGYWAANLRLTSTLLGISWKRMKKEGAIAAMLTGLLTTFGYIYYFKFGSGMPGQFLLGVSPEGIGFVFMWLSLGVGIAVALMTKAPPQDVQDLVDDIRVLGLDPACGR